MKYKYIFWDFNGTIINDVDAGIESVNLALEARGLPAVATVENYKEKFDFPIKDYYLSLGFDFSKEPFETVACEWFENYQRLSEKIPPVEGVVDVVMHFAALGLKQYILSASERSILELQLKRVGIDGYFEDILCLDNIYADSKLEIALEFFDKFEGSKNECIMIGDTTHDAEVAGGAEIDCILVSCGHMSRQRLEKTGCTVLDDMNSLVKFIK